MWGQDRGEDPHSARRPAGDHQALWGGAPGAFSILPPADRQPATPDPPLPQHNRFNQPIRSHRNAAFAIIADSESNPNSRATSPTGGGGGGGRVSPFRGRGFNPIGSRHASPHPHSPPPPDGPATTRSTTSPPRKSLIPTVRRPSNVAAIFGEQITDHDVVPARLPPPHLSKQLSQSLTSIGGSRQRGRMKPPPSPRGRAGFRALSPIVGSSPEPSQGTPSKIPRSRSQPPTRAPSRATSRDPSPSKTNKVNYRNVKAKVNSFHATKPKVAPKPQVPQYVKTAQQRTNNNRKPNNNNHDPSKHTDNVPSRTRSNKSSPTTSKVPTPKNRSPKSTSPLNLDAEMQPTEKMDSPEYLPDARALSAKSVTTAMNRMNSTVLDAKTVMKETGLSSKLSPAAKAIISMSQKSRSEDGEQGNSVSDNRTEKTSPPSNTGRKDKLTPPNSMTSTTGRKDKTTPPNSMTRNTGTNGTKDKTTAPNSMTSSTKGVTTNATTHTLPSVEVVRTNDNEHTSGANGKVAERKLGVSGPNAPVQTSGNELIDAASDVQPIRINVKEKASEEAQSGNVRVAVNGIGGTAISSSPPPHSPPEDSPAPPTKSNLCTRIMDRCSCCKKRPTLPEIPKIPTTIQKRDWFACCRLKKKHQKAEEIKERISSDLHLVEENVGEQSVKWWHRIKCCKGNRVGDTTTGCFPIRRKNWAEVGETVETAVFKEPLGQRAKNHCKNFFRRLLCWKHCDCRGRNRRKREQEEIARRASVLSKKKSITPSSAPPEETKAKLDISLVEHTSQMKGAIPVLPVPLAWFCLILNVFIPGSGTVLSGFFCLCMGIPRFSQRDGIRPRIGSFLINTIIGCGQLFTVIFCLVGWGWSIWWGVTMIKLAKKYRRIKRSEQFEENEKIPTVNENHRLGRDLERGH